MSAGIFEKCPRKVSFWGGWLPGISVVRIRLNSCFSWKSPTFPESLLFEKFNISTSFPSSDKRPSMRVRFMTSSPTAFIMRSRRSSEMRTDFACGKTCGAPEGAALVAGSATGSFGDSSLAATARLASAGSPTPSSGANSSILASRGSIAPRISASLSHCRCSNFFSTSTDCRQISMMSAFGCKCPSRNSPIRSSTRCATAERR